jgi:hypothetical protein
MAPSILSGGFRMRWSTSLLCVVASAALMAFPTLAQEKIGVEACDTFFVKYEACIAKMQAAQQAQFKGQMEQLRSGWKAMAGNPQTKATLEATCTQMSTQMKAAVAPVGCEW